ncbi:MAG: glycogen/starch/alpha-glucan phosphorylase [Desulfobacterium sp.]|nr:glycogen/starch/alpha-glucan phosphorylase [Desulfobacterium sp.]
MAPCARPLNPTDQEEDALGGNLEQDISRHILSTLGDDPARPNNYSCFTGLAFSVRERLIDQWIKTQQACSDSLCKRVYYLSLEFLPGRFLKNYLISLGMEAEADQTLAAMGFDLDNIEEEEWDAGLGNGGLGRLASCYMDSMARLRLPGYGYGIRYDYGIFHQVLENGYQREQSDNWMRRGNPWDIKRRDMLYKVRFFGRSESYTDVVGATRYRWEGDESVMAMACDILVPGYRDGFVTNMRLWIAKSSREFDLEFFNRGDYIGAVENKVVSETISKVLYPSDELEKGRMLRLRQQYFFVSATLQDIFQRYKKQNQLFDRFPDFVAIQLNDTHPAIAVPELMRLFMDEESLTWDKAWDICVRTFAYTNHTVLPEALETWPVEMVGRLLPRHLEIIFEINRCFLEQVRLRFPDEPALLARMSIVEEGNPKRLRMAHLAIVGSHSVNGVAELHSSIIKQGMFKDFNRFFPGRLTNVTNGITPRRWLYQANPLLSELITSVIGDDWICDLSQLRQLIPFAGDPAFCAQWMGVKLDNKKRLARYILRKTGLGVNPRSLFDVHVKRMHEYKRQLLNILHVVTLYNRLKAGEDAYGVDRTVIFAGKAAPAYDRAKLIIKLITSVGEHVNRDADLEGRLKIVFLPNYCISQAEKVIPAADLSEQISTAGMEASGTGNMKFALNGALTLGTLDGANVEIMEEVGLENIFIFGLKAEEVAASRQDGYDPRAICESDPVLRQVLTMIDSGYFSPEEPGLFTPIINDLLHHGDYYRVLADYRSYVDAQGEVARAYARPDLWARSSIMNTACMGKFSSDRAVMEYAERIWGITPLPGTGTGTGTGAGQHA